jgi:hypothetical protein
MWFVDKLGKGPAASPTQATAPNGKAPEPAPAAKSAPVAAAPQAAPQPAPAPEQPKKKKGWF